MPAFALLYRPNPSLLKFKDEQDVLQRRRNQETLIPTQVNILQSDAMALLVIHKLNLDSRPEFAGPRPAAAGGVPTAMTLGRENQLIGTFESGLKVLPVHSTPSSRFAIPAPIPAGGGDRQCHRQYLH